MKCEVKLVFEETDGTLQWLFKIISYAHHISEPPVQKMLEPMLKEFLHAQSYQKLVQLAQKKITEDDLVQKHFKQGLIKFKSSQVQVPGPKIKAVCYMIEQAGTMQTAAIGEDVPDYILDLFAGHEILLKRIKEVVIQALVSAGAKDVHINRFSSE